MKDKNSNNAFMRKNTLYVPEVTESSFSVKNPQVAVNNILGEITEKKIETGVGELVRITGVSTVNFFDLPHGYAVWLNSTIVDRIEPTRIMFGVCEIDSYVDSFAPANLIPYGSNVNVLWFRLASNFSYANNENIAGSSGVVANPGSALTFTYVITNGSGVTKSLGFKLRWRYLGRPTIGGATQG